MTKKMNVEALQANLRLIDKKGELAFETARAAGTLTPEQEKFSALISDEAFTELLLAADSAEEAKALFAKNGLDLSPDELNAFGASVASVSRKLIENGGDLSEAELEQIAGGFLGFNQTEETIVGSVTSVGLIAGAAGGLYGGAAVGSMIFPGAGSVIGGIIGAAVGGIAGLVGGGGAGFGISVGAIKGVKKLGRWIKSWF